MHIQLLITILFSYCIICIGDTNSLERLARSYKVDDVAKFLTEIGLPEYVEAFREEEISGDVLLKADSEMLDALSVSSLEHQMKITQRFLQKLKGSTGMGMYVCMFCMHGYRM